jgi:hypothetical protein
MLERDHIASERDHGLELLKTKNIEFDKMVEEYQN